MSIFIAEENRVCVHLHIQMGCDLMNRAGHILSARTQVVLISYCRCVCVRSAGAEREKKSRLINYYIIFQRISVYENG